MSGLHLWCKDRRYVKEGARVHETNHVYRTPGNFSRIWFYIPTGALTQNGERHFTANIKTTSHNNSSMKIDTQIHLFILWSNILVVVFYLPCTKLLAGETRVSQRQIFLQKKIWLNSATNVLRYFEHLKSHLHLKKVVSGTKAL